MKHQLQTETERTVAEKKLTQETRLQTDKLICAAGKMVELKSSTRESVLFSKTTVAPFESANKVVCCIFEKVVLIVN